MSKKLQRHIAAAAKVDDFKKLVDILANLKVEVVQQELESSVALMMTSAEVVVAQSRRIPKRSLTFIKDAFGAVDTNLDEIKRRLKVWADIEEVPALQVDMAIDKDPKLRIGVVMEESKTAPGTSHQVSRPEEPIISRMLDELSAYFEIKHGRAPAAGDPKSEMFLQGVEFMRSSFQD